MYNSRQSHFHKAIKMPALTFCGSIVAPGRIAYFYLSFASNFFGIIIYFAVSKLLINIVSSLTVQQLPI